jgi:SagB-type dehydrogenase family enzyme
LSRRDDIVRSYHDATKHHFHRFARSLGYLDWASQPNPFRSFRDTLAIALPPDPGARAIESPIGPILRYALGLTAWKEIRTSRGVTRWSLRANPSSGNLHPTEAYVITGPVEGLTTTSAVYHYAPDRHALELRCQFQSAIPDDIVLIALTSIHWREAWKYGERAFRYCQHDLGHAIAAIDLAAWLAGWRTVLLSDWSHQDVAALAGVDRDGDYIEAEREDAGCVLLAGRSAPMAWRPSPEELVPAVRSGIWTGRANQLSEDHVQWTFIDEVTTATIHEALGSDRRNRTDASASAESMSLAPYETELLRARRSAVALDGRSSISVDRFLSIMSRTLPGSRPFDVAWWTPRIHLALFVHRVDGLEPGLYLLVRDSESGARLKAALGRRFLMDPVLMDPATAAFPLFCLARGDCRGLSQRLSCDQEIAADGFFSLAMLADFDASLHEHGPAFYRQLFWESGIVGQVLYLEAEAADVRGTGIGCFYDDPVHETLGLQGHAFQSLYHFTIGVPVEDTRLTTRPGYDWET